MGIIPAWLGWKLAKKHHQKLRNKFAPNLDKEWKEYKEALKSDAAFEAWKAKHKKKKKRTEYGMKPEWGLR